MHGWACTPTRLCYGASLRVDQFARLFFSLVLTVPLASACTRLNASHCGNQEGNASCANRGGTTMYCNVCVADNDGCVEQPPASECRASGDVTSDTTSDGATTTSTSSTTATSAPTSAGSGPTSDAPTASDSSGQAESGESSEGPIGPVCGDGVVEPPEQCDGEGVVCGELRAGTGEAPCNADCLYDTSRCSNPPECGDGIVETPEVCEPGFEPEQSCQDVSDNFIGGDLSCTGNCTYDLDQCVQCSPEGSFGCSPGICCPGSACECTGVGELQVCRCQPS